MKKFLMVCLLLVACNSNNGKEDKEWEKIVKDRDLEVINELKYYKDTKTNLCYGLGYAYGNYRTIVCVPCDSVKNLLK